MKSTSRLLNERDMGLTNALEILSIFALFWALDPSNFILVTQAKDRLDLTLLKSKGFENLTCNTEWKKLQRQLNDYKP